MAIFRLPAGAHIESYEGGTITVRLACGSRVRFKPRAGVDPALTGWAGLPAATSYSVPATP